MARHEYTHSESFARLKGIKESIGSNLTSYQYLSVLDDLLYRAVEPLVTRTRFFDSYLAQILAWQTQNPKRKVSGIGKAKLSAKMTLFFLVNEDARRIKLLREMKLDRTILFEAIRKWTALVQPFMTRVDVPIEELSELYSTSNLQDPLDLAYVFNTTSYWYDQALSFKNKIIEKYTRLCLTTAQRDYVDIGHSVELGDMVQIYLLTASKAIDKCDTDKGVLTTHISNWLLSAKNIALSKQTKTLRVQRGQEVVDTLADSAPLSEVSQTIHDNLQLQEETDDLVFQIRRISKIMDPRGYGRLALGITEELSEDDRNQLHALALG